MGCAQIGALQDAVIIGDVPVFVALDISQELVSVESKRVKLPRIGRQRVYTIHRQGHTLLHAHATQIRGAAGPATANRR
jgi:hypothetical protein